MLPKLKKVSKIKKPKILLLADDLNTTSGIATMARTFVFGTVEEFDWVQLAAAVKHIDHGKVVNISDKVSELTGVGDASVVLYPNSGYGDQNTLRKLLEIEKPDAILHFTDPRFWTWLYDMEHEIHNKFNIPICYYAIWDNLPYPFWNKGAYASCDLIMGISKQSHLIHNEVLKAANVSVVDLDEDPKADAYDFGAVLTKYVPHGIDTNIYHPLTEDSPNWEEYQAFKTHFMAKHDLDFIFFWCNRNITRKRPSTVIQAFGKFVADLNLPEEQANKIGLIMHTDPIEGNGTNLISVKQVISPNATIIFSPEKLASKYMNFFYNIADCTINIASNEGFGLSSAESIAAGTPVLNNVTGGLQDQMGFIDDNGYWLRSTPEYPSNHIGMYTQHGDWSFPVFPDSRVLQGSVPTPFIFDDVVNAESVSKVMLEVYESKESLKQKGSIGREWLMSSESMMSAKSMSKNISEGLKLILEKWKGGTRYTISKVLPTNTDISSGIIYND